LTRQLNFALFFSLLELSALTSLKAGITETMSEEASNQPHRASSLTPEMIEFASRMYDAARKGDVATLEQALPAGLPPNLTNDKGDTLV